MKNLFILSILILFTSKAHALTESCTAAVIETLIRVQAESLQLTPTDKAKYAVEMYGDLINDEGISKDAKVICAKAYIKAIPLPEAPENSIPEETSSKE